MDRRHNAAAARLARLYFGKSEGEEIRAIDFCDRMENLAARSWGVAEAATSLASELQGKGANGVIILVTELAEDLERLSEAYGAELMASRSEATRAAPPHGNGTLSPFALAAIKCQADGIAFRHLRKASDMPAEMLAEAKENLLTLARTPCLDSDISDKLRLILRGHKHLHPRWREEASPALMEAVNLHFGDGDEAETTEEAGGQ